ncbi:MAG: crossover junction endodeoxyribonuclease RuvC [Neisseriaceae bacterium]
MRILGIDPGSRLTGFGLIEIIEKKKYTYVVSGVIKTEPKDSLPKKIHTLATSLQAIIDQYSPDEVAIEQVFINVNPAASLVLGQARGGILAAIALKEVPIHEYTALQVKKALVGKGKASKSQVQYMVKNLLNFSGTPAVDAADAMAVALTHYFRTICPVGGRKMAGA